VLHKFSLLRSSNLIAQMRLRGATRMTVLILGLSMSIGASAAFASVDQEGKATSTQNIDGSTVDITPSSFNASSGQCVIYSLILFDSSTSKQVETGLAVCNGPTIDGTCTSGHSFSERYDGSAYYCAQGSAFAVGSPTNALIERTSGTTSVWGATGGSYISQSGFGATDMIPALAWAEASGGVACPTSPHSVSFANWKKFLNASGWSYVSSANPYSSTKQFPTSPCWTVGSLSASGGFNAS